MSTLAIDQTYLTRLAESTSFGWMGSLRPLRVWRVGHATKRCCGKPARIIPSEVFKQIAVDRQFEKDLRELKVRLKLTKLIVNIGGYRSAL